MYALLRAVREGIKSGSLFEGTTAQERVMTESNDKQDKASSVSKTYTKKERKREVIIYPCITQYNKETIHYMYYMTFNNAFCRYILKQSPRAKKDFLIKAHRK